MKRRPTVRVARFPAYGRYQIFYLGGIPLGGGALEGVSDFRGPFVGPLTFDCDNNEIVDYRVDEIECITFEPEDVFRVGNEKFIRHFKSKGYLKPYDGTFTVPFEESWKELFRTEGSTLGIRKLSYDEEMEETSYLQPYAYKSPGKLGEPIAPIVECNRLMVRHNFAGGAAFETFTGGGASLTWCHYDAYGTLIERTIVDVLLPKNLELQFVDDYNVVIPTKIRSSWWGWDYADPDYSHMVWLEHKSVTTEMIQYSLLFVSPAMVSGPSTTQADDFLLGSIKSGIHAASWGIAERQTGLEFQATRDAVEALKAITCNGIAFVKDLIAIAELVKPIVDILKDYKNLKNWRQLILWYKYGVAPSVSDLKEVYEGLRHVKKAAKSLEGYVKYKRNLATRYGTCTSTFEYAHPSSGTVWEVRERANARIVARHNLPTMQDGLLIHAAVWMAEDMDLKLTTENVWDLVPLSFVVDWFVDIGSMLANVDYSAKCLQLSVRDWVHSSRRTCTSDPRMFAKSLGLYGTIDFTTYVRDASVELPAPSWGFGNVTFLRHWWEGALIILNYF